MRSCHDEKKKKELPYHPPKVALASYTSILDKKALLVENLLTMKLLESLRKKAIEVPSCLQQHMEDYDDPPTIHSKLVMLQSIDFPMGEEQKWC